MKGKVGKGWIGGRRKLLETEVCNGKPRGINALIVSVGW